MIIKWLSLWPPYYHIYNPNGDCCLFSTFFFLIILEKPILSPKMFKTSTTGKQFDKEKLFRKILMIYYYDFAAKAIQVATDPIWPRLFRRL